MYVLVMTFKLVLPREPVVAAVLAPRDGACVVFFLGAVIRAKRGPTQSGIIGYGGTSCQWLALCTIYVVLLCKIFWCMELGQKWP